VGQGSPYKNHANIVRAFLQATHDRPDLRLVLVRRFARVDGEMRSLLSQPDVRRKVIAHPFVPSEVLLGLYGHARMLVFASHYEGCGMPAMEAMALGTPVVASRAPAVIEMTGNAALHVESTDVADIASKIRRLLADEPLRKQLIEAGLRRVKDFSWDQCARETLDFYRSVS
jgi:glycosyltransferase involved in cell wall biosynthesis